VLDDALYRIYNSLTKVKTTLHVYKMHTCCCLTHLIVHYSSAL